LDPWEEKEKEECEDEEDDDNDYDDDDDKNAEVSLEKTPAKHVKRQVPQNQTSIAKKKRAG
jgi:hypothetical protein